MEELGEVVRSHDPLSLHVLLLVVEYGWDIRVGLLVRERDEGSLVERKAPVSFEEIYGMQTYWGHSLPDGQDIWSQAEEAISVRGRGCFGRGPIMILSPEDSFLTGLLFTW